MRHTLIAAMALIGALAFTSAYAESVDTVRDRKEAQIPVCDHPHGTLAVYEPDRNWWSGENLESPEALVKIFVSKSHCFTLVDRGKGLSAVEQERDLNRNYGLQRGSNVGRGQIRTADFVLVPDLASKNEDSGGSAIFGIIGAFIPGAGGALVSGIHLTDRSANVTLTLTNVKTSEQVELAEGTAKKTDLSFGSGGGLFIGGVLAGGGVSGYENTKVGQVVALAYLNAYTQMVNDMHFLETVDASSASVPGQAVTMTRPGRLYSAASIKSKPVRSLAAGTILYPTGNKNGIWWEVSDEIGNRGWVSSLSISLAQ